MTMTELRKSIAQYDVLAQQLRDAEHCLNFVAEHGEQEGVVGLNIAGQSAKISLPLGVLLKPVEVRVAFLHAELHSLEASLTAPFNY